MYKSAKGLQAKAELNIRPNTPRECFWSVSGLWGTTEMLLWSSFIS
jgi:hypothetical protein